MAIDRDQVLRMAALAALGIEPDEIDRLAEELSGILEHFESIRGVDVGDVPPFGGDAQAPLRPDLPGADPLAHGPRAGAPGWEAGFFTVPRLASHAEEEGEE